MANYPGHLCGGIVAFCIPLALGIPALLGQSLTSYSLGLWLALCLFGALFPDIDIHSKGRILWYRLLFVAALLMLYFERHHLFTPLVILAIAPFCLTHRGITHRWWFVIVVPLLCAWGIGREYTQWYQPALTGALFFIAGALSHLALDYGPRWLPIPRNIQRMLKKLARL